MNQIPREEEMAAIFELGDKTAWSLVEERLK